MTGSGEQLQRLKSHAHMKDSRVPWLANVPSHWDVRRGKWLFRTQKELNVGGAETNVLSLTLRGVVNNPPDNPEGLVPRDYASYQLFRRGDLVFKLIDLENRQTSRVGLVHEDGIMSPAYVRLTPRTRDAIRFFFQQYYDLYQRGVYNQLGAGVRSTLGATDLLDLPVVVPPIAEQKAIVRVVDRANELISRAIAAKQKLVRLLDERRRLLIHEALQRGVAPGAATRSSGIDWLGDVPTQWDIVPLGQLVELVTGFPFKSDEFSQADGDVRLLRGINVTPGQIRWADVVRWPTADVTGYRDYELREGDVVLGMDRPIVDAGVRVARVGPSDVPSLLLQRVARIRPRARLDADFILLLLASKGFADYLAPIFTGVSVPHISPQQIRAFRVGLPSLTEQREIVERLSRDTQPLDAARATATRQAALLVEYRERLLSDIVTGKVDVREAAAALPDAGDPPPINPSAYVPTKSGESDGSAEPIEALA